MSDQINIGFVPLTDAASLIVAVEMGIDAEEGLHINLMRENSWSAVRDKLTYGLLDGAHLLYPMAIAMTMGQGGPSCPIDVPMVLSMNGNTFVAGIETAKRLREAGADIRNAKSVGHALVACAKDRRIRVAVPFLQSMHVTMLRYLITKIGAEVEDVVEFSVCPPSLIEQMLASGEVDAFMVGAPWGASAVEHGLGETILASSSIWKAAPEKVLGIRRNWMDDNQQALARLLRVLFRAGKWASDRNNSSMVSELLSRPEYLNVSASIIERTLNGEVVVNETGKVMRDPLAFQLDARHVGFPWQSSGAWVATENAPFWEKDTLTASMVAQGLCRPDLYRSSLESLNAPMPAYNSKIEGSLTEQTAVDGVNDPYFGPDAFFDGAIFEPD